MSAPDSSSRGLPRLTTRRMDDRPAELTDLRLHTMLGPSAMRAVKAVFLVLGAVLLGVLVYRVGAAPILETLRRLTWWQFALVCLPYAVIMAADTLGWRFAFARDRAPFHRLYGARLAGEALNIVTALGAVGGEAAKAWLLRRDVTYEESLPSVATATIIEAFGSGVRFATFLVPANLGSSEAANAGAFAGLGLGAAAGLAFSFVRRARQAVWVGVGLAVLVAMRWSAARAARAR